MSNCVHEVPCGHQATCIQILEWFMIAYRYVCEICNFQVKTNRLHMTKLCAKTLYIGFKSIKLNKK